MKSLWRKLKNTIGKICLVDRFLMLFMIILLLYTAVTIFTETAAYQDSSTVDVIVRTSAAAIFGYFISSNFIKTDLTYVKSGQNISSETTDDIADNQIKNKIGFTSDSDTGKTEMGNVSVQESSAAFGCYNKLQITIVSVIGILSLILLLTAGKLGDITPVISETVSQLRDFISACVGFLVSCGKSR